MEEITIRDLANNGCGVGTLADGRVIFVPFTIPGERIRVKITEEKWGVAFGEAAEVLEESPDAQEPGCPDYAECGGCCFRHLIYERELQAKEKFVCDAFARAELEIPEFLPILPSPQTETYRNKAEFAVQRVNGKITAGFYARGTHRVIPCGGCSLIPPEMTALKEAACERMEQLGIAPYDPADGSGLIRHLIVRRSSLNGELLLGVVVNGGAFPHEQEFCAGLHEAFPLLRSIVLNENTRNTSEITGRTCRVLSGKGYIRDELCRVPVRIGLLSFFQVNPESTRRLYETARTFAGLNGSETVLDLYCGMGTIGLFLAADCRRLIGCEIVPEAVESAKRSAAEKGVRRAEFLRGDAGKAAQRLLRSGLKPDAVIIDPPRRGCDRPTLEAILHLAPEKIVSVSCDPATNARDLAFLCEHGYQIRQLRPVDLFPRTAHVECVALLVKQSTMHHVNIGIDAEDYC